MKNDMELVVILNDEELNALAPCKLALQDQNHMNEIIN